MRPVNSAQSPPRNQPTAEAIVHYENRSYVFRERSGSSYELVEVLPGISNDGKNVISWTTGEPAAQEHFVTKDAYALLMTMMNKSD